MDPTNYADPAVWLEHPRLYPVQRSRGWYVCFFCHRPILPGESYLSLPPGTMIRRAHDRCVEGSNHG